MMYLGEAVSMFEFYILSKFAILRLCPALLYYRCAARPNRSSSLVEVSIGNLIVSIGSSFSKQKKLFSAMAKLW
jgi:hypothetical protein